jgi:hypothetical protein
MADDAGVKRDLGFTTEVCIYEFAKKVSVLLAR